MKKIYLLIFVLGFILSNSKLFAQKNSCGRLTSAQTTVLQSVCINQAIVPVTYEATGADTAFITGLPNGVAQSWSSVTHILTLNGTPNIANVYNYKITFRGCPLPDSVETGTITVNSLPTATILSSNTPICSGTNALFKITGTSNALVTYKINSGVNKTVALTGGTAEVIVNAAVSDQTLKLVSVTNPANGCMLPLIDSSAVTVIPLPTGTVSGSTSVCQGDALPSIIFKGDDGTLPYTFSYTINGGLTKTIKTQGTASKDSVYAPTYASGSFTYNLISVTDSTGCTSGPLTDSTTAIVSVFTKPFLISPKTASVCDKSLFNYKAISYPSGTIKGWKRDPVAGISNLLGQGTSAIINESLDNSTDQPVEVEYIFNLSNTTGCATTDTLKVTVNPTPLIKPINDYTVCNGQSVSAITFSSSSPDPSFTWTSDRSIGFGTQGSNRISSFIASNNGNSQVTATVTVSIYAGSGSCAGPDSVFRITVLPTPHLTSITQTSVCDTASFNYAAKSSASGIIFSWSRPFVNGISNPAASGNSQINEKLNNNDTKSQPVIVKYIFSLTNTNGCVTNDTLKVTVHPTPLIIQQGDTSFCKGNFVNEINFKSTPPNSSFTWTCVPSIGFGASGSGNIPAFYAGNSISDSVSAKVTVSIKTGNNTCPGPDSQFTITVFPLLRLSSTRDTSVCDSVLFNYTAKSLSRGINFRWERPIVDGISNLQAGGDSLIRETLLNTTSHPVEVKYLFTLFSGPQCDAKDSVMVIVNPTPRIAPVNDIAYCNGDIVDGIKFFTASPDSSFAWKSDKSIGFGRSGNGSIPIFTATNAGDSAIIASISVVVQASSDRCSAPDSTRFKITVFPELNLSSTRDTSVCDSVPFSYIAKSSARGINFRWERPFVIGISNPATIKENTNLINETLDNVTSQPVVVKYIFTLSASQSCKIEESVMVTVNPTPVINPVNDTTFCNGSIVKGINFSSASPNSSFSWSCDTSIGFGESGNGSIPVFTATNTDKVPLIATITVSVTASKDNCPGESVKTFRITVNPSPPKPVFSWLNLHNDSICKGSDNISFNIASPLSGISYKWTSKPGSPDVLIRDTDDANTVISFPNPGNPTTIKAFAINSANGGCVDSVSQVVKISNASGIDERRILLQNPGNLLIYPDNSLNPANGYQWGYDSLVRTIPDRAYGPPKKVEGQVYQFFIPESRFIVNNALDTIRYSYWVILQEGNCYSRVYYNGPYARLKIGYKLPESNTVELKVFPNPNNGIFEIVLKGNIYGNVNAKMYNSLGQMVATQNFVKNTAEVNESFNAPGLQAGLYYLVLHSSDLKKVVARFIIQH